MVSFSGKILCILIRNCPLLSQVGDASLPRLELDLLDNFSDSTHSNNFVDVLFLLKTVTGDRILSVPVHSTATAITLVGVSAETSAAGTQILIPQVEIGEGPEAVGDGCDAVLQRVPVLLDIGESAGWSYICILFSLFVVQIFKNDFVLIKALVSLKYVSADSESKGGQTTQIRQFLKERTSCIGR